MTQLILCAIVLLFVWRTEKLRDVAMVYAIVHVVFTAMAGPPEEAAARYGYQLFYLCAAAEAGIIIWTWGIRHDATRWVIACSAYNLAVHLIASIGESTLPVNPIYDGWNALIRIGELSQIACMLVFSRPIFSRLQAWYSARQRRKGLMTWLAKSNPVG
jgi:hypothetical protein